MSYLVLARKYRPQRFKEVVGQSYVTETLRNAIESDRVAHALLFSGPRGVGKTSVARIVAKAMNCKEGPAPEPCNVCTSCVEITRGIAVDVFEIDGASNRGIDEIRELRENIKYMPGHSRFKIYIIDEVHMLTREAFNALLKTLEEPPGHVLFIFATTEAHKIPTTILSRCQRHDFRRIGLEDILGRLEQICQESSLEISQKSSRLVALEADGSMRDALSLLDQIMAYSEGAVTDKQVLDILGVVDRSVISDLSSALITHDIGKALSLLDGVYSYGHDLKRLTLQMVEHFRHLVVVKMGHGGSPLVDLSTDELALMEQQVEEVSLESLNQVFSALFEAEPRVRYSPQPKLVLEMLFIKLAQSQSLVSFDDMIKKLNRLAAAGGKAQRPSEAREVRQDLELSPPPAPEEPAEPKSAPPFPEEPAEFKSALPPQEEPTEFKSSSTSPDDPAQTWQRIRALFSKEHPSLAPNLEKGEIVNIGENVIEIRAAGNSFYTARLRDKKNMAALQGICDRFFERKMKIKIVESKKAAPKKKRGKESDKERRLRKDALEHPLVTDALDIFKGRVVDVKIL